MAEPGEGRACSGARRGPQHWTQAPRLDCRTWEQRRKPLRRQPACRDTEEEGGGRLRDWRPPARARGVGESVARAGLRLCLSALGSASKS